MLLLLFCSFLKRRFQGVQHQTAKNWTLRRLVWPLCTGARVKTLGSSCFIKGSRSLLLELQKVRSRERKTGKEVTASISVWAKQKQTQLLTSLWDVFWDFECEPTHCSLFWGGYWLVNNCHSTRNLSVKVRRNPCMRELPLSTFPKNDETACMEWTCFLLTIMPWSMRMCLELLILGIVLFCFFCGSDIILSKCTTAP